MNIFWTLMIFFILMNKFIWAFFNNDEQFFIFDEQNLNMMNIFKLDEQNLYLRIYFWKMDEQILNSLNKIWNQRTNFEFGEQFLKLMMNNFSIWWTILEIDEQISNLMNNFWIRWFFFEFWQTIFQSGEQKTNFMNIFTHWGTFFEFDTKNVQNFVRKGKKKTNKFLIWWTNF